MWSTKKAYLGEDTPFRGTHKFGTSIKPIVKNEGVSHPSPFTHKIYIFCCLLLYQMKENPLDYICASFQANQIINKWTMPPFVNFKKVEIFEPLLLRTKKNWDTPLRETSDEMLWTEIDTYPPSPSAFDTNQRISIVFVLSEMSDF